jgi:hypothetical protein
MVPTGCRRRTTRHQSVPREAGCRHQLCQLFGTPRAAKRGDPVVCTSRTSTPAAPVSRPPSPTPRHPSPHSHTPHAQPDPIQTHTSHTYTHALQSHTHTRTYTHKHKHTHTPQGWRAARCGSAPSRRQTADSTPPRVSSLVQSTTLRPRCRWSTSSPPRLARPSCCGRWVMLVLQ